LWCNTAVSKGLNLLGNSGDVTPRYLSNGGDITPLQVAVAFKCCIKCALKYALKFLLEKFFENELRCYLQYCLLAVLPAALKMDNDA
jgi:hypothetical protein